MVFVGQVGGQDLEDIILHYAQVQIPRGPFNNKFLAPSGSGGGFRDGKNPTSWNFGINLTCGFSAGGVIDAMTGAVSNFSSKWPPAEPAVDSRLTPFLLRAKEILPSQGANAPYWLTKFSKTTVSRREVVDFDFVDGDAFPFRVSFDVTRGAETYSPFDLERREAAATLMKLGVPGPLRITFLPSANWRKDFEGPEKSAALFHFVSRKNEKIDCVIDDAGRFTSIEREPLAVTKSLLPYPVTLDQYARANEMLKTLGLGGGQMLHPATKSEHSLEFTSNLSRREIFSIPLHANLSIDPSTLSVNEFRAPTNWQINDAEKSPRMDADYLALMDQLGGEVLGSVNGKRFARAQVRLGDGSSWAGNLKPALGWISADHGRITALDGIDYAVDKFERYDHFEDAVKGKSFMFPYYMPDLTMPTLATPALLVQAGQTQLAARLLRLFRYPLIKLHLYNVLTVLDNQYRLLLANALEHADDAEGLRFAQAVCKIDVQRLNVPVERQDLNPDHRKADLQEAIGLRNDFERRLSKLQNKDEQSSKVSDPLGREVHELIDRLEDVNVGDADFQIAPPLVMRLVDIGSPAIPYLNDAIKSDRRFTRTVSYNRRRTFVSVRAFHPVREVEEEALRRILSNRPNQKF